MIAFIEYFLNVKLNTSPHPKQLTVLLKLNRKKIRLGESGTKQKQKNPEKEQ